MTDRAYSMLRIRKGSAMTSRHTTPRHITSRYATTAAALIIGAASLTACGSDSPASTPTPSALPGTARAALGDLMVVNAYVPKPASPDVAAAYFTVVNRGDTKDTLTSVSSDVSGMTMAMTESDQGTSGRMVDLGPVAVPAHGSFAFTRGGAHVMLEKPSRSLQQGDHVRLTIRFTHAGALRLSVPVVPLTGPDAGGMDMDMGGEHHH